MGTWLMLLAVTSCIIIPSCRCMMSKTAKRNLQNAEKNGQDLMLTVKLIQETPSMSKLLKAAGDVSKMSKQIGAAEKKLSAMLVGFQTALNEQQSEQAAELVSNSVNDAVKGLLGLVNGIRDGDWVEGVQGALSIVSGIAAIALPGYAILIPGTLSAISTFLGIFGGSESENQQSMTRRVVEGVLNDYRRQDMKEYVEGAQQVYQAISSSINEFRDSGKLEKSQAEVFFSTSFSELSVFGRLKTRIGEACDKPADQQVSDCIGFIKMYVDMSILRQMILVDMASLMYEDRINLPGIAANILNSVRKEQENDLNLLSFLGNPESNPSKRPIVAAMFGHPELYTVMIEYLNNLHLLSGKTFWKKSLILCNKKNLQGDCLAINYAVSSSTQADIGEYRSLVPVNMDGKVQSFYVPLDGKVSFWSGEDYTGTENGPHIGPALHGAIVKEGFRSLKYTPTTDTNVGSVRFCEGLSLEPTSLCEYWEMNNDPTVVTEKKMPDRSSFWFWPSRVASFYIPEETVLYGYNARGDEQGPYFGPHSVNKLCAAANDWSRVLLKRVDWDARKMVLLCDQINLGGSCFQTYRPIADLTKVLGRCNFATNIKSLRIPGGLVVMGYKAINHKTRIAGPYEGPVTIDSVDFPTEWRSLRVTGQNSGDIASEKKARDITVGGAGNP